MTLLLISSTSFARAPDLGPDPIELEAGKSTPFAGTLMTKERMLLMSKRANNAQRDTDTAVSLAKNLMQVKLDKADRDLKTEIELGEEKERLWRDRLAEVEPWYERPIFVSAASIVGFALAILLARETIIEVHGG